MWRLMRAAICLGLIIMPTAALAADASFQRVVGQWTIAGDRNVGACLMYSNSADATRMTIASLPHQETIRVALANPAWKSLADDEDATIDATFSGAKGITDSWRLAATFTSAAKGGPRINFEIEKAANDDASFIDQMRTSTRLTFWRKGTVSLASYSLAGSAAAISALMSCRAHLRTAPDFDPFAG